MKAVIIDDESDSRAVLRGIITHYCPEVKILGEADGVETGVRLLREYSPEVLFLDIQLADGTGFDLLDFFPVPTFQVVFITAHDTFALRAFQYHATNYLLKPITPVELVQVIERLKMKGAAAQMSLLPSLKASFRGRPMDKIAISTTEGFSFLSLADILRLEAEGSYTTFFMNNGEKIVVSRGIKEFEDLLPATDFCRIHQSHMVQVRHVRKFLKEDGGYALMSDDAKIPVSRRKKAEFLELLMG